MFLLFKDHYSNLTKHHSVRSGGVYLDYLAWLPQSNLDGIRNPKLLIKNKKQHGEIKRTERSLERFL